MTFKTRDDKIRDFCKLQHACQKLSESLNIICDLGISHEELEELANSEDAVDQALAISPCMSIASYVKSLQGSVNLTEIYKYYEFNADETPVDQFITMEHITPLPSSTNLTKVNKPLNINTNDVEATTRANGKQINQKPNLNNDKKFGRDGSTPMRKGKNLDPSLANNNKYNNNNKPKDFGKKGAMKNNNNNGAKFKKLDPALAGNSRPQGKSSKSSNNHNNNFEEVDNEASAKLHAALGKYNLAPDYSIRQLHNGSFEAICKIKGMNLVICKGYGRNKKAAQHNAATVAFTSQELIDLLSSRV
ncbi:hypothetical protein C6P44_003015 [Monosporozyma unispora]|nr:hypothetical protein C6P44_003015 [Kazachstania unispora]